MVKYFSSLNYSLANEDTSLEFNLVRYFKSENILSVCGSGSRALPLLHPAAKSLKIVDLVKVQLELGQLRYELVKNLSCHDYKKFFGYPPYRIEDNSDWRKQLINTLNISDELKKGFESHDWNSLLYVGKWESTFVFFSKMVRFLLRSHAQEMFRAKDLQGQRDYFKNAFPWKRWNLLVKLIGNKAMFNALLYKGDFVVKNVPESYFEYYDKAFKHLFNHDLITRSFFMQLLVMGKLVFPEGNLQEVQEECYEDIKTSQASLEFIQSDLISSIKNCQNLDFISLSDVPSYFKANVEKDFLQDIKSHLNIGGIVVMRSYLRVPQADRSGYKDLSEQFKALIDSEKVQMYKIEILQRIN